MVKYTGRGLVVKRPGVLSKVQMLNLILGVGVFSLLPIMIYEFCTFPRFPSASKAMVELIAQSWGLKPQAPREYRFGGDSGSDVHQPRNHPHHHFGS